MTQEIDVLAPEVKPLLTGLKRQHFLPRFYLEGFAKDGFLAVYDRQSNDVRVQAPLNTGVIGHFYTLEDSEGRKRFELEQMLCEFEGKASSTIPKLAEKQEITDDERTDLAIFIALACFRTPDIVESLKLMNSALIGRFANQLFDDVAVVKERMRGKPGAPTAEEELEAEAQMLVNFAQGGQYTIETSHHWAIGLSIEMAFQVAPILAGRNWAIIHRDSEKKSFITADAPVWLTTVTPRGKSIWGVGFANADAMVLFPLTQSCALVMFGDEGDFVHRTVDATKVRQFNSGIAAHCQRFVIGRDEALVRSLAKSVRLHKNAWKPKLQMN